MGQHTSNPGSLVFIVKTDLAGILAFLWLETFPFLYQETVVSELPTNINEDLQLQVQPRILTGFPCIGLGNSPISKSVAKI